MEIRRFAASGGAVLLAACASPARPPALGDPLAEAFAAPHLRVEEGSAGPPPKGEFTGYAAAGYWSPRTSVDASTPSGRVEGNGETASGGSLRAGMRWETEPSAKFRRSAIGSLLGPGDVTTQGLEVEWLRARASGDGGGEVDLSLVEFLGTVGIRSGSPRRGDSLFRAEFLIGGGFGRAGFDGADFGAIGADASEKVGLFVVGFRAEWMGAGPLGFTGRIEGGAGGAEDSTTLTQARLGARLRLGETVFLEAGWRSLSLQREEEEWHWFLVFPFTTEQGETGLTLRGLYAEVAVDF
jgi:hypothetical protein